MKNLVLIFSLFFALSSQTIDSEIPELNQKIIDFVNQHIGKKVGRGECWDLAQIPLEELGATWDQQYVFGKKINIEKETVFPGDIIQFEKVVIQYTVGNKQITENFYHHTAIVYEVLEKGIYKIAQQNTEKGKKVTIDLLNTNNKKKGKMIFYRPQK
ncbi:MAG: hypothetical protein V4622_10530 [Bacteroidota bacterium]